MNMELAPANPQAPHMSFPFDRAREVRRYKLEEDSPSVAQTQ